jgi:hypothetical protein
VRCAAIPERATAKSGAASDDALRSLSEEWKSDFPLHAELSEDREGYAKLSVSCPAFRTCRFGKEP